MTYLKSTYPVSERRACKVVSIHRSSYRYEGGDAVDEAHVEVVRLSRCYPYWGYRKIHDLVDRPVGRERVRLIRRREGLQVIKKGKKKKTLGKSTRRVHEAQHPNHVWSYDFVTARTSEGRAFRILCILDEDTRECLAIVVGRKMSSEEVVDRLFDLFVLRAACSTGEKHSPRNHSKDKRPQQPSSVDDVLKKMKCDSQCVGRIVGCNNDA